MTVEICIVLIQYHDYYDYLQRNKPSLVRILLKLMADVSVSRCDIYGNTPLHYATAHENTELVSLLLPLVKR